MPAKFKKDIVCILILLAVFVPIYTLFLYEIPYQVNTDEIAHMFFSKLQVDKKVMNPFSMSGYFYMPAADFLLVGWAAQFLGGINLVNGRIISGLIGVFIVVFSYLFFRVFSTQKIALIATILLASNHTFIAFNRMAVIHNHALLIEVMALFFLFKGVINKSKIFMFIGGLMTGLSFYTYFPGRVTVFLWILFPAILLLYFRAKYQISLIFKLVAVSLLGVILVVVMPVISSVNNSEAATDYARHQILLFPEGRKLQQEWIHSPTIFEGIKINIINGITVFNNKIHDLGYIYPNYNHGFLDPISGILIWVGFLTLLVKTKKSEAEMFILGGFLLIWLGLTFLTTKNPNYGRLLVILPFVAYLIAWAIETISKIFQQQSQKLISVLTILVIFSVNLVIFADFIYEGQNKGNDVGGTGRFVEARKHISGYKFYLSADKTYPYYSWADQWQWRGWISFFAKEDQSVEVLSAFGFISRLGEIPFTVFMSKPLWEQSKTEFVLKYPNLQIHNIKPDGSLLAIEVK